MKSMGFYKTTNRPGFCGLKTGLSWPSSPWFADDALNFEALALSEVLPPFFTTVPPLPQPLPRERGGEKNQWQRVWGV